MEVIRAEKAVKKSRCYLQAPEVLGGVATIQLVRKEDIRQLGLVVGSNRRVLGLLEVEVIKVDGT